jgi:hypothetical protein
VLQSLQKEYVTIKCNLKVTTLNSLQPSTNKIGSSRNFRESYLSWGILQSKSPGTLRSPNGIRNISFMPYKSTFITKVIELLILGKIKPHILNKLSHKNYLRKQEKLFKFEPTTEHNLVIFSLSIPIKTFRYATTHNTNHINI